MNKNLKTVYVALYDEGQPTFNSVDYRSVCTSNFLSFFPSILFTFCQLDPLNKMAENVSCSDKQTLGCQFTRQLLGTGNR